MGVTRNWRLDTDCTSKIHLVKDVRSVCSDKFLTSSSSRSLFHFVSCIFAYWERMITSRVSMATVESETNDLRLLFELIGARVGSKIRHLKWQILFVLEKLKQMAQLFVYATFCYLRRGRSAYICYLCFLSVILFTVLIYFNWKLINWIMIEFTPSKGLQNHCKNGIA